MSLLSNSRPARGFLQAWKLFVRCLNQINSPTRKKPIYWDILIPNSRPGNKIFVHCSSRYQAGHVISIFLYLLLKFILGNSYSSYKSSAKTYWEYLNNQCSKPLYFPIKNKIIVRNFFFLFPVTGKGNESKNGLFAGQCWLIYEGILGWTLNVEFLEGFLNKS